MRCETPLSGVFIVVLKVSITLLQFFDIFYQKPKISGVLQVSMFLRYVSDRSDIKVFNKQTSSGRWCWIAFTSFKDVILRYHCILQLVSKKSQSVFPGKAIFPSSIFFSEGFEYKVMSLNLFEKLQKSSGFSAKKFVLRIEVNLSTLSSWACIGCCHFASRYFQKSVSLATRTFLWRKTLPSVLFHALDIVPIAGCRVEIYWCFYD